MIFGQENLREFSEQIYAKRAEFNDKSGASDNDKRSPRENSVTILPAHLQTTFT